MQLKIFSDIASVDPLENAEEELEVTNQVESSDDEVFKPNQDETGDIDIDSITSNNIESEDLLAKSRPDMSMDEGADDVGEEFDYKTSMIGQYSIKLRCRGRITRGNS